MVTRILLDSKTQNTRTVIVTISSYRKPALSAGARLFGLLVRIPLWAWMSVYGECCVSSGRGFCVGLITSPEESY
jgi:hypothetical protein